MRYSFKDLYTDRLNDNVIRLYPTRFYSPIALAGGAGTRINPKLSKTITGIASNDALVFGGGVSVTDMKTADYSQGYRFLGNGYGVSILDFTLSNGSFNNGNTEFAWFKNLTINAGVFTLMGYSGRNCLCRYDYCEIIKFPSKTGSPQCNSYFNRCILRDFHTSSGVNNNIQTNNSYVSPVRAITSLPAVSQILYEDCDIAFTNETLASLTPYYKAFERCRFRIGAEEAYTELMGNTPDELRSDFVARCLAQGYDAPEKTEANETLKFYRWIFTKNSCFESNIPKNSDIHKFEIPRSISFGAIGTRVDKIPVTSSPNIPNTISPAFPNSGNLTFQNGFLNIPDTIDITDKNDFSADSNIIWLGGKKKLTSLSIIDNLPQAYGLQADGTPDLLLDNGISPGGTIEPGKFYIVRSKDKQPATIVYNGVTYTTSIATGARNNIVYGVSSATTYTASGGTNPVLYEIWDELQYKTIKMRIVNKIPADIIRPATALLPAYWYLVEHDTDQSNTTDYVTYNGVKYPPLSSFYIYPGNPTSFTASGNIHLRRCWKSDFDINTESVDKTFWQNEQKPKWFDVTDNDLRCLLINNNDLSAEMMTDDDGNYIASGHPLFYKSISGEIDPPLKPMPVKGTYMQIRIMASTLNPG